MESAHPRAQLLASNLQYVQWYLRNDLPTLPSAFAQSEMQAESATGGALIADAVMQKRERGLPRIPANRERVRLAGGEGVYLVVWVNIEEKTAHLIPLAEGEI